MPVPAQLGKSVAFKLDRRVAGYIAPGAARMPEHISIVANSTVYPSEKNSLPHRRNDGFSSS